MISGLLSPESRPQYIKHDTAQLKEDVPRHLFFFDNVKAPLGDYIKVASLEFHQTFCADERRGEPAPDLRDDWDRNPYRCRYIVATDQQFQFLGGMRVINAQTPEEPIDFEEYFTIPEGEIDHPAFCIGRFTLNNSAIESCYSDPSAAKGVVFKGLYEQTIKAIMHDQRGDQYPNIYAVLSVKTGRFVGKHGLETELVEGAQLMTPDNPQANLKGITKVDELRKLYPKYWNNEPRLFRLAPYLYTQKR